MFCAEASCEIRSVTEAEEICLVEICSINDDDLDTVSPHWAIVMTEYKSSDELKELLNDFSPVGAFFSYFPHSQPVDCCS